MQKIKILTCQFVVSDKLHLNTIGTFMSHQGMIQSRQGSFNFVYRLIDLSIIFSGLFAAALAYRVSVPPLYTTIALAASVAFMLCAETFDLYRSWRASTVMRMIMITSATWCLSALFVLLLGFFANFSTDVSRFVIGGWFVITWISLISWRFIFFHILWALRARGYNSRVAAIVGLNDTAIRMRDEIKGSPDLVIRFTGFYDDRCVKRLLEDHPDEVLLGCTEELINQAKEGGVDLIFIALPIKAQARIAEIKERCGDTSASVHLIPDFFTYNLLHARRGSVEFNDFLKRSFDVVFSSVALCLIAFPMLIIAAAVKCTSRGPIIFKQARYGLDGKKIFVWKFRSMSTLDNGTKVVQATKGDARMTKVGAFIRRTSLDELPQFINVLQGRMSVVGPRPHAVAHNEEYRKLIPYYMLRHSVKPGITGWAQINGFRGETDTLDKMEGRIDHDLEYIRNWSLLMDIKIIFLTVFKGFVGSHVH
ncbi:MAG: putative colanic acid biosynthesis UDP-glucose lipid carrier transferase [Oleispira sp.]|jgi:putative colanic acid biosynthesis UDP-glucose lipid carrier transferase